MLTHEEASRVLHRDSSTHIAVNPFHGAALVDHRTLSHEVQHVRRPVLHRGVTNTRILLHENLNDTGVQGVLIVNRSGATFDVVNVGTFVSNNQGSLELSHCLGVDTEIGLKRNVHVYTRRDVNEGTTRPCCGIQSGKLVVPSRNTLAEVLFKNLRMLTQTGVGVSEDHALLLQVILDLLVDDLGFILSSDARNQAVLLGLGNAQTIVGITNFFGEVFPVIHLTIGGTHVVLEGIEIDTRKIRAPRRHWLTLE